MADYTASLCTTNPPGLDTPQSWATWAPPPRWDSPPNWTEMAWVAVDAEVDIQNAIQLGGVG